MAFNGSSKPGDWVYLRTDILGNALLDADRSGGNLSFPWHRFDGPIFDSFTSGTAIPSGERYTEQGQVLWYTWPSGAGAWSISGGSATFTGGGRGIGYVDVPEIAGTASGTAGNRTVEVAATCASGTWLVFLHEKGYDTSRVVRVTIGDVLRVGSFVGTTTITAGAHTVKCVCTSTGASTFAVAIYLDGVFEGSTTLNAAGDASAYRSFGMGIDGGVTATVQSFKIFEAAAIAATTYSVRNAAGAIVASGAMPADGTAVTIADSALEQYASSGPYGWYHLMLSGPARAGSTTGDRLFHDEYGDIYFGRLPDRASLGSRPALTASSTAPGNEWVDPLHGWLGLGPVRLGYTGSLPSGASTLAGAESPYTYYVTGAPTNRPRYTTWQIASGTVDMTAMAAIVNAAKAKVKVWEPFNEPEMGSLALAQSYVTTYLQPFYATVKAADATAIVMGPSNVGPTPGDYQNFVEAGGLNYCDAVSFHAYNLSRKDIGRARRVLANFLGVLRGAGFTGDVWQTEQGQLMEWDGRLSTVDASQEVMLQVFLQEINGIPMEHNVMWYDKSHGFDSYPGNTFSHYLNGVSPLALAGRNMAAELFNSTLTKKFDFGDDADLYLGGVWGFDDGTSVLGFMAQSATVPNVTFNISGATGTLVYVDTWGNASTVAISAGQFTLAPGTALHPAWVRLPAGATVTYSPRLGSVDYALASNGASVTTTGASASNTSRVIDGAHHSVGEGSYTLPASAKALPQTWQVDLGQSRTFDRIDLRIIGPTAFTIDTSPDASSWTTKYTYAHSKVTLRYAGNNRCFWANYDPPDTSHTSAGSVTARYVRVVVTAAMWGEVYIPSFGVQAEADETYSADTSLYPMSFHVQVPSLRVQVSSTKRQIFLVRSA